MPNYLICVCGNDSFKIISEKDIICIECGRKTSIKKLSDLNDKIQEEIRKQEINA